MLPIGDRAAGWIRSHAKGFGPEYACHLRIGRRTLGNRKIVLLRVGRKRRVLGTMADRPAHARSSRQGGSRSLPRNNGPKRRVAASYILPGLTSSAGSSTSTLG